MLRYSDSRGWQITSVKNQLLGTCQTFYKRWMGKAVCDTVKGREERDRPRDHKWCWKWGATL